MPTMPPSAIPRVAVVGGGLTGTLASLVLRNRGLRPVLIDRGSAPGGRLRGAARLALAGTGAGAPDAGAQFLRASAPRFAAVLHALEGAGAVAKWEGRFGILGSQGGGFLPSAVVGPLTGVGSMGKQDEAGDEGDAQPSLHTDAGDFCGFVTNQKTPAYVGVPDNASLCAEICRLASIEQLSSTTVVKADALVQGGWQLAVEGGHEASSEALQFDALVIASHDPRLAAATVQSLIEAEARAARLDGADDDADGLLLQERLTRLAGDLTGVRASKQPIFTWAGRFPTAERPFDAVSVPGSHVVQFLAREASKPGRAAPGPGAGEIWTAVSTAALARDILAQHGPTRAADDAAAARMAPEVARLLGASPGDAPAEHAESGGAAAVRWGAAFSADTLGLKEDSVYLHPWRLAIAGDFVRHRARYPTPLEAGALSGMEAGERIAALFAGTSAAEPRQ